VFEVNVFHMAIIGADGGFRKGACAGCGTGHSGGPWGPLGPYNGLTSE